MFALDLDELDVVARRIPFFSRNRANLYSFRDHDHLNLGQPTLKENLLEYLRQQDVEFPNDGRVTLVTLPRVLGYVFNPVSFYFCFDATGEALCVVVQVGNTFREMKPYLVRRRQSDGAFRLTTPKLFYVSPFSELDLDFDFRLRVPAERLNVHINDLRAGQLVLASHLNGERRSLTARSLLWLTLKYPCITLKVIFLIHWNAFLLWLRKVPWYAKAAKPEDQRGVLKAHHSITGKTS
jgi:DUF1365 family protein